MLAAAQHGHASIVRYLLRHSKKELQLEEPRFEAAAEGHDQVTVIGVGPSLAHCCH